jgi:hypothetical protein
MSSPVDISIEERGEKESFHLKDKLLTRTSSLTSIKRMSAFLPGQRESGEIKVSTPSQHSPSPSGGIPTAQLSLESFSLDTFNSQKCKEVNLLHKVHLLI